MVVGLGKLRITGLITGLEAGLGEISIHLGLD
jgi:hypothetical protein